MPADFTINELIREINAATERARLKIADVIRESVHRTNLSAMSRAKSYARARLTSRGAESYASYYKLPMQPMTIGLRNVHPLKASLRGGVFNVADALERTGVRPHTIRALNVNRPLRFFWHSEHMKDTMSAKGGDNTRHKRMSVEHSGIRPQYMMRDALNDAVRQDLPTYLQGIRDVIIKEVRAVVG